MGEFSFNDIQKWLQTAYDKHASVQKAIYYCLFFECQNDASKYNRAINFFEEYMKDKMSWVKKEPAHD